MPKQKVIVKNQNSRLKQSLINLSSSNKGKFLLFLLTFAVIGGSYMAYRSFAAVSTPVFYLNNGNDGSSPEAVFAFGNPGDQPIACDWDGNRNKSDGIGVWQDPSVTFHLSDTLNPTKVNRTLPFGNHGDKAVCGDWNGDKKAGVGVYRPSNVTWYLSDEVAPNKVSKEVKFGDPGDIPIVCDWDGNGKDDIGVYRPSKATFYLSFSTLGYTDLTIPFGNPGDLPVCGNWDGAGGDGIGIYRPSNATFYLSDTVSPSKVNRQFVYGNPGDKPIVGDWDGDGVTSVGIYRMADLPGSSSAKPTAPAAPKKATYTCVGTTTKEVDSRDICIAILTYAYAGHPDIIAKQIAASDVANAGGTITTTPIPAAPVSPTPTPAGPVDVGTPTLQLGSTGAAVSSLQSKLAKFGYWIAATGDFNAITQGIVKDFQGRRGIGADGVVGPQTWGQIGAAEAQGWKVNGLGGPEAPQQPVNNPQTPPPPPAVVGPTVASGTCYLYKEDGFTIIKSVTLTRDTCYNTTTAFWNWKALGWTGPNGWELLRLSDTAEGWCRIYGGPPSYPELAGANPITKDACRAAGAYLGARANHADWQQASQGTFQVWPTYFKRQEK